MNANVDIRARHIAGALNVTADKLSRKETFPTSADYMLAHWAFDLGWINGELPEVDLFSSAMRRGSTRSL